LFQVNVSNLSIVMQRLSHRLLFLLEDSFFWHDVGGRPSILLGLRVSEFVGGAHMRICPCVGPQATHNFLGKHTVFQLTLHFVFLVECFADQKKSH
jgi:hypothetical protein